MPKKSQKIICSICERPFTGYGNNACSINEGRCCDLCNSEAVIPERFRRFMLVGDPYAPDNALAAKN